MTLDSKIQTTISEASSDPFCPLPLKIVTPVNLPAFERYLQDYPFTGTRHYLISGFRYGLTSVLEALSKTSMLVHVTFCQRSAMQTKFLKPSERR